MDSSQRGFLKFYGSICLIGLIGVLLHNVSASQVSSNNGEFIRTLVILVVLIGVLPFAGRRDPSGVIQRTPRVDSLPLGTPAMGADCSPGRPPPP